MEIKELALRSMSINHQSIPKISMMYRGTPSINEKLLKYFRLTDLEDDWEKLVKIIRADIFSDGKALGAFTTFIPKYIGPKFDACYEPSHFFIWEIKPRYILLRTGKEIVFHRNPPLYDVDGVNDLLKYNFPKINGLILVIIKE